MTSPEKAVGSRPLAGRLPAPGGLVVRAERSVISAIGTGAPPGTRAGSLVDRLLPLPWHAIVAYALFASALLRSIEAETARGHPMAWLAVIAIPAGLLLLRRPLLLALVMAAAGTYLRALYLAAPETCDQLEVSRAALGVALGGGHPYGIGYAESWPPGSPFPYGPLAMVASVLGVPGEVLAVTGIMLILACSRALITLAVLSAWVVAIEFGICGLNDQVPALLLLSGLLLIERGRAARGAVLLVASAAIKPYTFAWFPSMAAAGGAMTTMVLAVGSAIAWLPVLMWGPGSFLHSIELARATHPIPENTLNMPYLRVLALPIAFAALLVRSWTTAVLTGALIFLMVLFFDHWASVGYWFVVGPIVGIVTERGLVRFGARLRASRGEPSMSGDVVDALPA